MLSTESPPSRALCTPPQEQHWGEGKLEDTTGAEGWRRTGEGGDKGSYGQAGRFSMVLGRDPGNKTDLPDNYHLEISATSQEVAAIEDQLGTLLDHEEQ